MLNAYVSDDSLNANVSDDSFSDFTDPLTTHTGTTLQPVVGCFLHFCWKWQFALLVKARATMQSLDEVECCLCSISPRERQ